MACHTLFRSRRFTGITRRQERALPENLPQTPSNCTCAFQTSARRRVELLKMEVPITPAPCGPARTPGCGHSSMHVVVHTPQPNQPPVQPGTCLTGAAAVTAVLAVQGRRRCGPRAEECADDAQRVPRRHSARAGAAGLRCVLPHGRPPHGDRAPAHREVRAVHPAAPRQHSRLPRRVGARPVASIACRFASHAASTVHQSLAAPHAGVASSHRTPHPRRPRMCPSLVPAP